MDEKVWLGLLFEFYGSLLTERQQRVMELYYSEDYSLGEISELEGISRQGVRDAIKRSEQILTDTEAKLHLANKYIESMEKLNKLKESFYNKGDNDAVAALQGIIGIWERE